MSVNARSKGKRGEYEVRDILQGVLDEEYTKRGRTAPTIKRNLEQVRGGGYDLDVLPWLAVEVKRREMGNPRQWWEQCKAQAQRWQVPVLFYRANNEAWHIRMMGQVPVEYPEGNITARVRTPVDISLEGFLTWFRVRVCEELDNPRE